MSAFLALVLWLYFWLLTIPLLLKNLTEEEAWLLLFGQPPGLRSAGSLPVSIQRCRCLLRTANPGGVGTGVLVRAGYPHYVVQWAASAGPTTNVFK